tara:strand:+ start:326 stop:562 length:237 start_codon:yes stop_codon:yes gene_type:complete
VKKDYLRKYKMVKYKTYRVAYYTGILALVLYAFPNTVIIKKYVLPILNFEILTKVPVVSVIAIGVLVGGILAFKRKFG